MSHEEYWDYLEAINVAIVKRFGGDSFFSADYHRIVLQLTASPYHYWLENRAAMGSVPIPPPTEAGSPSTGHIEHDARGYPVIQNVSTSSQETEGKGTAESGLGREDDRVVVADRSQSPPNLADAAVRVYKDVQELENKIVSGVLAEKAQEIRAFVRANINDTEHKHMTKSAKNALLLDVRASLGGLLCNVPDDVLIAWHENWIGAVK